MTGWSKVVNEPKSMIEIGPSWQKATADDASEIVLRFALFLLSLARPHLRSRLTDPAFAGSVSPYPHARPPVAPMLRNVLPLLEVNTLATIPSTVAYSLTCAACLIGWDNGRGLGLNERRTTAGQNGCHKE
jgi:hypothetical protein